MWRSVRRVVLCSEDGAMTNWLVFEAGSRAGLSATAFFRQFRNEYKSEDTLCLIDDDETFMLCTDIEKDGVKIIHKSAVDVLLDSSVIFPADELTRQSGMPENSRKWFNSVYSEFYDKRYVSFRLENNGVRVPRTLFAEDVIVKPNSMSAGSKGIYTFDNCCVQQRIDVKHEYVVDMFVDEYKNVVQLFPREVKLRAGYDKYIRFLWLDHKVAEFAKEIVAADSIGIFRGPCHVQIIEDASGMLYYVEGSKRISGSSLVNILRGYNPFALLNGIVPEYKCFDEKWHLFDELLVKVEEVLK